MADPQTRHSRGLLVVIALAVIFFVLLALIVLRTDTSERAPDQITETLTVLPVRIRVRTEPNARAPVVATATSGERVTMLEDRGAWVRVQTSEELSGWAERANLERTSEQQRRIKRFEAIRALPSLKGEVAERVSLYAGPGIFYPLVGTLAKGADVTVFTRDHDFYAVAQGKGVAYADVDSIDISSSGTHQLEVPSTTNVTETAAAPPIADTATTTEPPPVEPTPEPQPESVERTTGVYSAVPPGGTQPEELDRAIPRYPPAARRAGVQGPVVIRGIVRRDGTIDNLEIIKDLPYGLGDEARRAVSRWRFRPATYRGEPIDVYYTVTVNFRLQ
ncbi:MAG TPA: TonB family protein [Thermoanaerobaculia bacterium]|jgi:TonB family protein|nr:TonB family protein [Thermoanaerobaculia bacterium]